MHLSIVHFNEQFDPQCILQTYHHPNQPHKSLTQMLVSFY